MRRPLAILATLALTGGLLGSAPSAHADTPDCTHPIDGFSDVELVLGITKTKTDEVGVYTLKGCDVDGATAVIKAPRTTYRIKLTKAPDDPTSPSNYWVGRLSLNPTKLRNGDAGVWPVTYQVTGDDAATGKLDGHVRRATRATFDAGPEPVKNDTITYSGKLERADWAASRYRGISRSVTVQTVPPGDHEYVDVATFRTRKDGTYRYTQKFPGPNSYWLAYAGTDVTAGLSSKPDHVDAS